MPSTRSATATHVAVFNCALYPPELKHALHGKRVVRYWSDIAPFGDADTTRWLLGNAHSVFYSPIHADRFPWWNGNRQSHSLVPPPVDYLPFREAAQRASERRGTVSVSAWRGWGKIPHHVYRWAEQNQEEVSLYGGGQCARRGPNRSCTRTCRELLARYERFVYLPVHLEPFCRLVAEADAAGCEVVANRLVGALHWLQRPTVTPSKKPPPRTSGGW